jgi:hypothetical protein
MTGISIEDLGLTKKELAARIVDRAAEQLLNEFFQEVDEDGEEYTDTRPTKFRTLMQAQVKEKIDNAVEAIALKNVLPNVETYVENLCLQETNKWGEKRGEPLTFTEYLVKRAEAYLTEQVNYQGKVKAEDSYNWRPHQTRVAHIIHEHMNFHIKRAMEEAVKNVNTGLAVGLTETVRLKLEEIAQSLKLDVKTGR